MHGRQNLYFNLHVRVHQNIYFKLHVRGHKFLSKATAAGCAPLFYVIQISVSNIKETFSF